MISKDLFVETLNFIKERNKFEKKFNSIVTEEYGDCVFFPSDRWLDKVIQLLSAGFDYEDGVMSDWIYYFIYELDFGKKWEQGCVAETKMIDGKKVEIDIPLGTPENLYDMLFKTACGDKFTKDI
jgi:hypothetical protein